jgi:hypothetical protein
MTSMRDEKAEEEPGIRRPIRETFPGGCTSAVSGTASKLRMSVMRHPMALDHIVVSSCRFYVNLLLSVEAERLAFSRGRE